MSVPIVPHEVSKYLCHVSAVKIWNEYSKKKKNITNELSKSPGKYNP